MATTLATTFWSLASFSQGVQDIIEETEEPQEELREERAAQARAKKEEEEAKLAAFDVLFVTLMYMGVMNKVVPGPSKSLPKTFTEELGKRAEKLYTKVANGTAVLEAPEHAYESLKNAVRVKFGRFDEASFKKYVLDRAGIKHRHKMGTKVPRTLKDIILRIQSHSWPHQTDDENADRVKDFKFHFTQMIMWYAVIRHRVVPEQFPEGAIRDEAMSILDSGDTYSVLRVRRVTSGETAADP